MATGGASDPLAENANRPVRRSEIVADGKIQASPHTLPSVVSRLRGTLEDIAGAGAEVHDEGVIQDRGHDRHARDSRDPAEKRKPSSEG
jgi:hypothetical protein